MGTRWPYWRNLLLFAVALMVMVAASLVVLAGQRAAIFYLEPARVLPVPNALDRLEIASQEISFHTTDGIQLSAWYVPPSNGAVILLAHGHGGCRSAELVSLVARHGYGALAWDFRAHGSSGGDECTLGYREALDVEAALEYALSEPGVYRVGALGESMGAAAVLWAAARRTEIEAVVLDSCYPALGEELRYAVRSGALRPIVRLVAERRTGLAIRDLNPVDAIGLLSPRPVLIIQGARDDVIAQDAGERLWAAAAEPRTLWLVPEAGHVGSRYASPDEYEHRVVSFFDAALLSSGQ